MRHPGPRGMEFYISRCVRTRWDEFKDFPGRDGAADCTVEHAVRFSRLAAVGMRDGRETGYALYHAPTRVVFIAFRVRTVLLVQLVYPVEYLARRSGMVAKALRTALGITKCGAIDSWKWWRGVTPELDVSEKPPGSLTGWYKAVKLARKRAEGLTKEGSTNESV